MPCTKFMVTSNARAVESLEWQPVCIMPAKAEPEKVSVIAQAPRTFLRTFITILLREERGLGHGATAHIFDQPIEQAHDSTGAG
jgi:hypothetical protein